MKKTRTTREFNCAVRCKAMPSRALSPLAAVGGRALLLVTIQEASGTHLIAWFSIPLGSQ